jgi:hypothetical protein
VSTLIRDPRGARAALALLAGLLVGGWLGGGLVWVLHRNQYKDPNTIADVGLGKADELELVPADALGFAHVRLADLWKTEALSEFRKIVEKAGPDALKALDEGFAPAPSTIDRATVVMIEGPAPAGGLAPAFPKGPPRIQPKGPPGKAAVDNPANPAVKTESAAYVILAFAAPFDSAAVARANKLAGDPKTHNGKQYFVSESKPDRTAVHFPSDRLIVIGSELSIQLFLDQAPKKNGPLASAIQLASGGSRHLVAAINMSKFGRAADQAPAELKELVPLIPLEFSPILRAEAMTIGIVAGSGAKADLRAAYKDDAAAQDAEKSLRAAAETGRKKIAEMKKKMETAVNGNDGLKPRAASDLPRAIGGLFALGAINMLDEWLANPPLQREGNEISATITMNSIGSAYAGMVAASVGMMVPAVDKVREAAARSSDSNNLKQIGLAFHMFHDATGRFPEQSWGTQLENGRMTGKLSWRVALLPYLEQQRLYQQFKLDEPWDSDNNKKLIPLMPKTYATPLAVAEPGKTYYKVFVGTGAIFDRPFSKHNSITAITDGTANTILAAEGGEPVIWTKPDDFEFDPKKPLPNIWLPGKPGINVLLADGSVKFINRSISEKTLRNAIQADDGEVLGPEW